MKYVFLVYQDGAVAEALDACRCDAIAGETAHYREHLRQNGYLLTSLLLQAVHSATTVRVSIGGVSITDGRLPQAKEILVEVCLLEARDLNEAIRVAGRMPSARLGRIEVRPLEQEESAR